jgi:hypothetical protein
MTVGEGKFLLYSRIEPPLPAGDYRFTASQVLLANGRPSSELPVEDLPTHVTVRSPRFALPPDQVLSTFPPAGSEGSYGSRLPQVVLRRRTLPWERLVQAGVPRSTPWLALVLVAEGEAELVLNQPVAECVTPGRTLPGAADVELGSYLKIRKSVADRIFPTQLDVPLLAHAREVDISDTELMMGDDDGFLGVIISNRLPLPGVDTAGNPVPVKYLACLVNLEGQFLDLIERAPDRAPSSRFPTLIADVHADVAAWDHVRMGRAPAGTGPSSGGPGPGPLPGPDPAALAADVGTAIGSATPISTGGAAAAPSAQQSGWATARTRSNTDVYAEMAADFSEAVVSGFIVGDVVRLDPTLRFPVLLHWSFTSFGSLTFRSLVEGLDSGLIGTVGEAAGAGGDATGPTTAGRQPLEVVETGHVGLTHRTRRGDEVRSWYRGPLVAHPTTDPPGGRLRLAHVADQLRIVVPDGREDISLAVAFEIGRLLALSRPSIVAALLRWRQTDYQTARREAVWSDHAAVIDEVLGAEERLLDARLGVLLGRGLARAVAIRPEDLLGNPAPLVTPGRPIDVEGTAQDVIARGFGLDPAVLTGDAATVLSRLHEAPVLHPDVDIGVLGDQVRSTLTGALTRRVERLVLDTVADRPPAAGPAAGPDALDRLLDTLEAGDDGEEGLP